MIKVLGLFCRTFLVSCLAAQVLVAVCDTQLMRLAEQMCAMMEIPACNLQGPTPADTLRRFAQGDVRVLFLRVGHQVRPPVDSSRMFIKALGLWCHHSRPGRIYMHDVHCTCWCSNGDARTQWCSRKSQSSCVFKGMPSSSVMSGRNASLQGMCSSDVAWHVSAACCFLLHDLAMQSHEQSSGLTLTCCSELVVLDTLPREDLLRQLIGRIHRFGQQQEQRVTFLVAKGTLQQAIHER